MSVSSEEWLPVLDYEGLYEVSNLGQVRSLDRTLADGRNWRGRILSPSTLEFGHKSVSLSRAGSVKRMLVHRLVMLAFVGPGLVGHEVRHLDGDPANNRLDNLAWGSHSENELDKVRHGTHAQAKRRLCPRGHALREPNLEGYTKRKGYRKCLACSRAAAHMQRNPGDVFGLVADRHFLSIMAGGPVAV